MGKSTKVNLVSDYAQLKLVKAVHLFLRFYKQDRRSIIYDYSG